MFYSKKICIFEARLLYSCSRIHCSRFSRNHCISISCLHEDLDVMNKMELQNTFIIITPGAGDNPFQSRLVY